MGRAAQKKGEERLSFNNDLENLPSATKLASLSDLQDSINKEYLKRERPGRTTAAARSHFAYLAGIKRSAYEALQAKSRTSKPSRVTARKLVALKAEAQELLARAGMADVEWPE